MRLHDACRVDPRCCVEECRCSMATALVRAASSDARWCECGNAKQLCSNFLFCVGICEGGSLRIA